MRISGMTRAHNAAGDTSRNVDLLAVFSDDIYVTTIAYDDTAILQSSRDERGAGLDQTRRPCHGWFQSAVAELLVSDGDFAAWTG